MIKIGLIFKSETKVSNENSAISVGSGDLEVFATPSMVALMENAAMNCVSSLLDEGQSTVGALINTSHLKPSPLGVIVCATATLVDVEGRKLTFRVEAHDHKGMIGEGTHIRYIIDRQKFLSKLS